jgi:hypothetical protein
MRKLIILKSLIDFVWILTCIPLIPMVLFFVVMTFMDSDIIRVLPGYGQEDGEIGGWPVKLTILIGGLVIYVNIYCVYLFRKTLRYFQKVKPFHNRVITNFGIIGNFLCYSGLVSLVLAIISAVYFKSEIKINLGFSPYLFITGLGLFFMVLSEVFKVAKHAKEENELTI